MSARLAIRRCSVAVAAMLLVVTSILCAVPLRAAGATYTVTTTDDAAADSTCGASCTLRQAIKASNLNDPGVGQQNSIQFGSGITGKITLDAAKGSLFVSENVAISGPADGVGVTVDGNHAVQLFSIGNGVTATISNLTIANGSADFGGGITNLGALSLSGVSMIGNSASNYGGGIYSDTASTLTITNTTFSGNSAPVGGGIALNSSSGVTITNATLSGNTAQANEGGGIYNLSSTVTFTNTIVAGNAVISSTNIPNDISGSVASGSNHNLIGTGGNGGLTNGTNGNLVGVVNPLLGPLGTYSNPNGAQTLPLLPSSPAINTGTATGAPLTDQRGMARVGMVDIGAFESQGFTLTKTGGDNQTTGVNTAFAPLIVTVVSSGNEPVQNGIVTFTGPAAGAGIQSSPLTGTIAANGKASVTPIANSTVGGPYAVTVSTNGALATVAFMLTNALAHVSGITPVSGSTTGGNTVLLTGFGFGTTANTQVLLDGVALPASSITSVSPTTIDFVAPAHASGAVTITVIVGGVTAAGSATYTYGPVAPLPVGQPAPSPVTPANPLPPQRPVSQPAPGGVPSPLPPSRP